MRYWKIVVFTNGGDYETYEKLIDEPMFRQFQKAYAEGKEDIILEDRIIKRKMIKEIVPADEEIKEHKATGMFKYLGLQESSKLESGVKKSGFLSVGDILEETR